MRDLPFPAPLASLVVVILSCGGAVAAAEPAPAGTVVVDASAFVHEIPKGDTIADAQSLRVPWVFNDTALVLRSAEEAVAKVRVPEAGTYHLFVRSDGKPGGSFRVSVGGRPSNTTFGDAPTTWKAGGTFELAAGVTEIRLTDVRPAPAVDVLVLTRNKDLAEKDLPPLQFPGDAELLKEYKVPRAHAVKFGDLTGDGRTDLLVLTPNYSAVALDHDGRELWRYDAPADGTVRRAEFEAPGSVWDFDRDGRAEVVHWRMIEGKEWLVVADGATGAVRHQVPWPTPPLPHVYNNFRTAIARFRPGHPDALVVLTDSGGTISVSAYDGRLNPLWAHTERRLKDHLGHYLYPVDLDGDGVDEVVVSHLALSAAGKELWNRFDAFPDHHDHVDDFQFADLDGDGAPEAIAAQSDVGVVAYQARTGKVLWQRPAAHSQQVAVGSFLSGAAAPQVAVTARIYGDRRRGEPYLSGQVRWFDPKGNPIAQWPRNPLNGNPDFVKGDWRGDGTADLFWFKFRMTADGAGALYFGDPVYHMFDFVGNGAEQVVTLHNAAGRVRVYGRRGVQARPAKRDAEYLQKIVANHSHY